MAEKRIRDIKQYLALYPKVPVGWKTALQQAKKHLNRSFNSSIGCSPHFKAYGVSDPFHANLEFKVQAPPEKPYSQEKVDKLRQQMKEQYESRHPKPNRTFKPDDEILVQGDPKKPHDEPFKVKEVKLVEGQPKTVVHQDPPRGPIAIPARNCLPYYQRALFHYSFIITHNHDKCINHRITSNLDRLTDIRYLGIWFNE